MRSGPVCPLDADVVSGPRRPRTSAAALYRIADVPAGQLFVSDITDGKLRAGIEITHQQDEGKAEDLKAWLDRVMAPYRALPWTPPPSGSGPAPCTGGRTRRLKAPAMACRLAVATRSVVDPWTDWR